MNQGINKVTLGDTLGYQSQNYCWHPFESIKHQTYGLKLASDDKRSLSQADMSLIGHQLLIAIAIYVKTSAVKYSCFNELLLTILLLQP